MKLERPGIVATLLWAFGIFIIGLTVYSVINWPGGWTENLHDMLLIFVAFSGSVNAIATEPSSTCSPCDVKQEEKP